MRVCYVLGKTFQSGNKVSHAENKTRRRFMANLQEKRLYSEVLGWCSMRLSTRGLKTIESKGGLDAFLSSARRLFGKGEQIKKRFDKAEKAKV